jgi:hypothetical protein
MMWRDLFLTGCNKRAKDAIWLMTGLHEVTESENAELNTYTGVFFSPFSVQHRKNSLDESPCALEGHPSKY